MSNEMLDWLEDQKHDERMFTIIKNGLRSLHADHIIMDHDFNGAMAMVNHFNDIYQELFALRAEVKELKNEK